MNRWTTMLLVACSVGACSWEEAESAPVVVAGTGATRPATVTTRYANTGQYAVAPSPVTVAGDIPPTPSDPLATAVSTPSAAVAAAPLRVYVAPTPRAPDLAAALQSALAGSGYTLVVDPRAGIDVTAQATATIAVVPSMIRVRVNGVERVKRQYAVTVAMTANGQVVDQMSTQFETSGPVSPTQLQPLVAALQASPRLAQYSRDLQNRHTSEVQVVQQQQVAEDRIAEEKMWIQARAVSCAFPAKLSDCDGVRLYLAKYPSGVHAKDANYALVQSQPRMEALQKDEAAWAAAGADACRLAHKRAACGGVEIYQAKYSSGMHADEAAALLQGLQ